MTDLAQLLADMARLEKEIAAAKVMEKIQNCKLRARTAHKYEKLQTQYLNTFKG